MSAGLTMIWQLVIVLVGLIFAYYFAGQALLPGVTASYIVVLGGIALLIVEVEQKIDNLERKIKN